MRANWKKVFIYAIVTENVTGREVSGSWFLVSGFLVWILLVYQPVEERVSGSWLPVFRALFFPLIVNIGEFLVLIFREENLENTRDYRLQVVANMWRPFTA
jgi:hypothetical protein